MTAGGTTGRGDRPPGPGPDGAGAFELFRRQVAEHLADHRREMERLLARAGRDLAEQRAATADMADRLEAALEEDRRAVDRLHASLSATLTSLSSTVEDLVRRDAERARAGGDRAPRSGSEETAEGPSQDRIAEQLEGLAAQMEALRRRIPLRARPVAAPLDEAAIAAIADAVAARLRAARAPRPPS